MNRNRPAFACAAVVTLASLSSTFAEDLPEPLRRFLEERQKAVTGVVEWTETTGAGLHPGVDGHTRFFAARFGGDTVACENHGDDYEMTERDDDARVGSWVRRPPGSLIADGQIWRNEGFHGTAMLLIPGEVVEDWGQRPHSPFDPRGLGLRPDDLGVLIHDQAWAESDEYANARITESSDGGLRTVMAELPSGAATRWWIDPAKGWSIVRATRSDAAGSVVDETRLAIEDFDGVWWPAEVQIFRARYHDGAIPIKTLQMYSVEVNQPGQPPRLTPADIGIVPGTTVMPMNEPRHTRRVLTWTGSRLIPGNWWSRSARDEADLEAGYEAYARQKAAAEAALAVADAAAPIDRDSGASPSVDDSAADETSPQATHGRAGPESPWQKYTREFIARYNLNPQQSRRAWTICRNCEADRDKYLKAHKDEFGELREAVLRTGPLPFPFAAGPAEPATAPDRTTDLAARRQHLEAPINVIFEDHLKPRLEKLPTHAQREKATVTPELPATTSP